MFKHHRPGRFVEGLLNDIDQILAHYIRAQLILAGLTGVVLYISPDHRARPLRLRIGRDRRLPRVHSDCGPSGCCATNCRCCPCHGIQAPAATDCISRRLACHSGLCECSSHHGKAGRGAPAGGACRNPCWCGSGRCYRCLPLDSRHRDLAYTMATLARNHRCTLSGSRRRTHQCFEKFGTQRGCVTPYGLNSHTLAEQFA